MSSTKNKQQLAQETAIQKLEELQNTVKSEINNIVILVANQFDERPVEILEFTNSMALNEITRSINYWITSLNAQLKTFNNTKNENNETKIQ